MPENTYKHIFFTHTDKPKGIKTLIQLINLQTTTFTALSSPSSVLSATATQLIHEGKNGEGHMI